MAHTYILQCANGELYVGSTNNLDERIKSHKSGNGSQFTHIHQPIELVYSEEFATYEEAFKR